MCEYKNRSFSNTIGFFLMMLFNKASLITQLVKNLPSMQETPVCFPGSRRSPGEGIGSLLQYSGFSCGSAGKESAHNAGDLALIPGLGRSTGKGYLLQYSELENSMSFSIFNHLTMWRFPIKLFELFQALSVITWF